MFSFEIELPDDAFVSASFAEERSTTLERSSGVASNSFTAFLKLFKCDVGVWLHSINEIFD